MLIDGALDKLKPRQEQAILALLEAPTVRRAAEQSGISEPTLFRWLREPAFVRALRRCRRESFQHTFALYQRYGPVAVNTLVQIMTDTSASAGARVSAATNLLRLGREALELDDLAGRVEALESAGQEQQPRWRSHTG